jgi:hypothetical protein
MLLAILVDTELDEHHVAWMRDAVDQYAEVEARQVATVPLRRTDPVRTASLTERRRHGLTRTPSVLVCMSQQN